VMAHGRIVAEVGRGEASEERILSLAMTESLTHGASTRTQ
jgi:hypothetical protein